MLALSESNTRTASLPQPATLRRYIPLLAWIMTVSTVLFIPLKILGYGYLPIDDALRHAAKVVSGKPWPEILVLAEWVKMDHNPGWHAILGAVHQLTSWQTDGLVMFSVAILFMVFCLGLLLCTRRPEVWLAVFLIATLSLPTLTQRMMYGRPLLLSAGILMTLLLMWSRAPGPSLRNRVIASILLCALAAWVHGSWYLFFLPVLAFALARQWRAAGWLGVSWLAGSFLGAMLTGHPIVFLSQAIEVPIHCFSAGIPARWIAIEFRPSGGNLYACLIVGVVAAWRLWSGVKVRDVVNNAPFILMVIGFLLGLKVMRFWLDWGTPALLCWLVLQLEEPIQRFLKEDSLPRLGATLALSAALMFCIASDRGHRWTASLHADYVSTADPEIAEWLPEPGAVMYNPQMDVFYRFFFKIPDGQWRYAMGFEPTFMSATNLAGYQKILDNPLAPENYEPWIKEMKTGDRMVIARPERLPISQLEWKRFGYQTWIGRLPRTNANSSASEILSANK